MKLFLDTANVDEIREAMRWGILSGITTNPSLVVKEKTEFLTLEKEIASIVPGDVSVETASDDTDTIIRQAHDVVQIADNVIVKVATTANGLAACRKLTDEGIKVNMTLCFSPTQAILCAEAGAYIVSPFLGRLDDISMDGLRILADICEIYEIQGYQTQVLAASLRHPMHVVESAKLGADIATMPFSVLEAMVKHPLTDAGMEKFLGDWEKAKPFLGELPPSYQEDQ
ncbi:MAG: fructose-6-phosphate aldolase [Actinomycetota bacterium]|nr:fructose-6-phosphate aldolase [Actinomycetota bacterium]